MQCQLGQIAVSTEQKHAAIPIVVTRRQIGFGSFFIRFLNKLSQLIDAFAHCLAAADIAIAGFGLSRHDAKGHQPPSLGGGRSAYDRSLKRLGVCHVMVSGKHQQQCLRVRLLHVQRGQSNSRSGITTRGLEN